MADVQAPLAAETHNSVWHVVAEALGLCPCCHSNADGCAQDLSTMSEESFAMVGSDGAEVASDQSVCGAGACDCTEEEQDQDAAALEDYSYYEDAHVFDNDGCYGDEYEDVADTYEESFYNLKRGGACSRSKGATKQSHKLDEKQRRILRSGKVKAGSKTPVPHRPFRMGMISYTPLGYEGSMSTARFVSKRPQPVPVWGAHCGSSGAAGHSHRDDHVVRATPFAIDRSSARNAVEAALADLQHRELSPEDYELLLRLDESVKAKTVASSLIQSFPTHTVAASNGDICTICMAELIPGDTARTLPCKHVFHAECIDQWLSSAADRCPVDSLPITA